MRHTPQSLFGSLLTLQSQAYAGTPESLAYHLERLPYFRSMLEQDCGLPQSQPIDPQPEGEPWPL